MVTSRQATKQDFDAIADVLRRMMSESQWYAQDLDEHRASNFVQMAIADPSFFCQVLESEGEIVGVMMALLTPIWWQWGDAAQDIVTYVVPEYRGHGVKLIKDYRKWAKDMGSVKLIQLNVSFGGSQGERSARLFERMGFKRVGHAFVDDEV